MFKKIMLLNASVFCMLAIGCNSDKKQNINTVKKNNAIDITMLDTAFNPADNFFAYVNAKWISENPIPPSKSRWGSFNILRDNSLEVLKSIQETAAADENAKPGSNVYFIGTFYQSAMDTALLDKAGANPVEPYLNNYKAANKENQLENLYAKYALMPVDLPVNLFVGLDDKDVTRYILHMHQSGLGLPEKDYYFRKGDRADKIRTAYKAMIVDYFTVIGYTEEQAEKAMQNVWEVELELAEAHRSIEMLRKPELNYNLMSLEQLQKLTPNFNWTTFSKALDIKIPKEINVKQPDFIEKWNKMLVSVPIEKWNAYFNFKVINGAAKYLGSEFENIRFNFYGKTLSGQSEMEPRWKRVTQVSSYLLRDILGQKYVEKTFDADAKKRALELVENIRKSFSKHIDNLTWMSDSTKAKAQYKLDKIAVKIGYPDKWRSYKDLQLANQHWYKNILSATAYETRRNLNKLGQEVDRTEWFMGAQTVNAYYNPTMNEIVFPAAILQPPFFYSEADDAVNYGGIGMVIGHEITHGFDDQGRKYDAIGNLQEWWTAEDKNQFELLADAVVKQYSQYTPVDTVHLNGELTLGENIADIGGIMIAYDAFKIAQNGDTAKIDGLTPSQRFFINFAQIWRMHSREQALLQQVYTDPHSPAKYRVNGPLSNLAPFYQAFNVGEKDKMYIPKKERNSIW